MISCSADVTIGDDVVGIAGVVMKQGMTKLVVALFVLAAGLWWVLRPGHGDRAPTAASRAGMAADSIVNAHAAAEAVRAVKPKAPPDSLDDRPLAEVRAELERRAQAGDARAASRLGQAFLYCNGLPVATDAQIDDAVVEVGAHGGNAFGEFGSSPDAQSSLLKAAMKYAHARCAHAEGLDEKDAPAQAFRWIERAAALGDADAQALYGEAMLKTYSVGGAIEDAERLRDRLQQARSYVAQSLSRGNALALLQSRTYYADGIYPANPETAYANLYAYSLTLRSTEVPPVVLALMLSDASKALDTEAIERAHEEGRRLAACCGAVEGEGR